MKLTHYRRSSGPARPRRAPLEDRADEPERWELRWQHSSCPVLRAKLGGMTTKERLHELVDEFSEAEAERALGLVEKEREDPVIAAFRDAPEDDEPWTEEDEAAAAEGRADIAARRTFSLEEVKREFDLR